MQVKRVYVKYRHGILIYFFSQFRQIIEFVFFRLIIVRCRFIAIFALVFVRNEFGPCVGFRSSDIEGMEVTGSVIGRGARD